MNASNPPLIEVDNLSKSFNGQMVLDGVSLKLFEGQVMSVIGKSGVGKSVLLKHIIGLLQPDTGRVLFRGQPVGDMSTRRKAAYLEKISYMFQNNALFNSMTVLDNVVMPLRYQRGIGRREMTQKAQERLEQMELADAMYRYPSELSGGMQKRVALARALVTDPEIVLFDEPTTGQDPIRKNAILSMIAAYQHRYNFSAILISHDVPDVFFISNTIAALYDGRIIFDGAPEDFEQFDHPFRKEFVQSLELLQQELTGLYSRRQFKLRYQSDLAHAGEDDAYTVAVFHLERMSDLTERLGHTPVQELIAALAVVIDDHFSDAGGFSTRLDSDRFVTVLPHADVDEAGRWITSFREALEADGMRRLIRLMPATPECDGSADIVIDCGVAEGMARKSLDDVIASAGNAQGRLAQLRLKCRRA